MIPVSSNRDIPVLSVATLVFTGGLSPLLLIATKQTLKSVSCSSPLMVTLVCSPPPMRDSVVVLLVLEQGSKYVYVSSK